MRLFIIRLLLLLSLFFSSLASAVTSVNLLAGWNLNGNSSSTAIDVAARLGDSSKITTVWKWDKVAMKWAFYAPSMAASDLSAYALSKGYDVLASIEPKEGFWVNASSAHTVVLTSPSAPPPAPGDPLMTLLESDLPQGWSLVSSADNRTPSELNAGLSSSLNAAGKAIISTWAWDAPTMKWEFYASSLEAQGGTALADYINSKSYLPFSTALSASDGFWMNIGAGSGVASGTGQITIVKHAQPNDAQDFSFTSNQAGMAPFLLDDDGDSTLSNQKVFANLGVGSYTFTETQVSGWSLASIVCTPSGGTSVNITSGVATIALAAGDDVTCVFTNTKQTGTGTLTIVKDAQPNDAQDFAFYAFGPNSGSIMPFLLDDDAGAVGADNILSNSKTFSNLTPGSYSVKEDFFNPVPVTGWDSTGIVCTSSTGTTVGTVDLSIHAFTVDLAAGDNVTCTFTNAKVPPASTTPDLSVTKTCTVNGPQSVLCTVTVTNNGSAASVSPISLSDLVTGAPSDATYTGAGGTLPISCSPGAGPITPIACTANTSLASGESQYALFSFTLPQGGTFTNCATVLQGNVATQPETNTANNTNICTTITVPPPATSTGTLTIVKDAVSNDAQDFAFYAFGPNSGSIMPFLLDDDAGAVGADNILSNSKTFSNLTPGSYSVKEDFFNPVPVTGWDSTGIVCTSSTGVTVGTVDLTIHAFTVDLAAGDDVICTFTNVKTPTSGTGTLTIMKDAQPNDAQDFAFYAFGPNSGSIMPFLLDDDAGAVGADNILSNSKTFSNLTPGSYSVKEDFFNPVPVTGWDSTGIVCTSSTGVTVGTVDLTIHAFTVDLAAGDDVICTFTNTKQAGSPTFTANGGPTLQVSTIAMIPTVLQTSTSFTSTGGGNSGTATVTAGPLGVPNDGIFVPASFVSPWPVDPLFGAGATLPSSISLTSGAALTMTSTSLAGAITPSLVSADFGVWAIQNNVPLSGSQPPFFVMTYSAYAGGTQLATTMPTGSVTYNGKMTGVLANTPVGGSDDVSGNVSLAVDFANGTIAGQLTVINSPGASTLPGTTAFTGLFSNITLSGGVISGNSFTASVTTPSIVSPSTATMSGHFYGTNANEVAGTFTISVPSLGTPGPGLILIGSFGAK